MKILLITLSNIGDVILTLPVLDTLKEYFPHADITVMSGPRPRCLFEKNPHIVRHIVYDKHSPVENKIRLFFRLNKENFDLVVDLRNTFYGAFVRAHYRISPFLRIPADITHMRDRHLFRLQSVLSRMKVERLYEAAETTLFVPPEDKKEVRALLLEHGVKDTDRIFIVSPGARSHVKRWSRKKFSELIKGLIAEFGAKIILVGDKDDEEIGHYIAQYSPYPVADLIGKTSLTQLAYLLQMARLVITNDSAILHIASYLNMPVVGIFGPTNENKYGPWSDNRRVAAKEIFCRPCEKAQCRYKTLECLSRVKVEDVLGKIRDIFGTKAPPRDGPQDKDVYRRILIVRTDRIGDVLLSTPVIKALRDEYPNAYIAMLVSPYARDIVEGNPYLDEVLIYDKDGKHKSWVGSMLFALALRKRRFDLALILHPINRVHVLTFGAGIPRRVGYNKKFGFLLTDRIKHTKHLEKKHETEYSLDVLRFLGIEPKDKSLFMPIKEESEQWAENLFGELGIGPSDKLLAVHPGASCPSKIWPQERFAQIADRMIEQYGFKVLVVSGPKDLRLARDMLSRMQHSAIDLAGKTSVSQLASVLKRCQLFISNDSGPVHIASAVSTPVISIFGRSQKGLGPERWGPVGERDRALHKQVGCIECLAHNCTKQFSCLKAITVEDVLRVVESIIFS